jgi:hypothetical protein
MPTIDSGCQKAPQRRLARAYARAFRGVIWILMTPLIYRRSPAGWKPSIPAGQSNWPRPNKPVDRRRQEGRSSPHAAREALGEAGATLLGLPIVVMRLGLAADDAGFGGRWPVCVHGDLRLHPLSSKVVLSCSCGDPGLLHLSIWRHLRLPVASRAEATAR